MLPKTLKYGSRTESAMARSYTSNIQPQGSMSGYAPGSVTTINIPTRTNLALVSSESVLKFAISLDGTDGTNARLDSCGAHGYIQRLRVFHGSNLLEDIDNYGMIVKEAFDLQVSGDASYGKNSILCGTRSDRYLITPTLAAGANAADIVTGINGITGSVKNVNSGEAVAVKYTNNNVDNARTYAITLFSILGSLCSSNYLPLFGCTSAPIRLEIQWVDSINKAMCSLAAVGNFKINNIEYIGSYIELSDNAYKIVVGSLMSSPLQFSMPSFRNYQFTYNLKIGVDTQVNIPIPAKYVSLKSLIVSIRDVVKGVNVAGYYPYSSCHFGLKSYYFRVGSLTVPAIAPSTNTQFFSELLKTMGSISDLNSHPSIDIDSYNIDRPVISTQTLIDKGSVNSGSFYIGLDLENYQGAEKSSVYSGYNSSTDDIYCVMNFTNPTNADVNARFDIFANYDQEVVFESNTCYVKY